MGGGCQKKNKGNDICVPTGMTIRWHIDRYLPTLYWQASVTRTFLAVQPGVLHLCDSTLAGLAMRRDVALRPLLRKCEYPPSAFPPLEGRPEGGNAHGVA